MSRGPLPEDPAIRALIRQARATQLSRRGFMTASTLSMAAFLAACSGKVGGGAQASVTAAADESATNKTVRWANWAFYLDEDDAGNHPTLDAFIAQSLGTAAAIKPGKIEHVQLLGTQERLEWKQGAAGLRVHVQAEAAHVHGVFRGRGERCEGVRGVLDSG